MRLNKVFGCELVCFGASLNVATKCLLMVFERECRCFRASLNVAAKYLLMVFERDCRCVGASLNVNKYALACGKMVTGTFYGGGEKCMGGCLKCENEMSCSYL
jgi:hypothetical protein